MTSTAFLVSRFRIMVHQTPGFNRTAINPIAANVTGIVPYGVMELAGENGNPTACCDPPKTEFGPRVGMAYQLNSKTTVRAGWGIFYAPIVFGLDTTESPGYTQATTFVASNNGNQTPANSLSNPFPGGILQPAGNSLGALTAYWIELQLFGPKSYRWNRESILCGRAARIAVCHRP